MNLRYHVELTEEERSDLHRMLAGCKHPARRLKRAQILIAAGAGSATKRSRLASGSAVQPSTGPSGASSKTDWRPHFARRRGREPNASSAARKKRF